MGPNSVLTSNMGFLHELLLREVGAFEHLMIKWRGGNQGVRVGAPLSFSVDIEI